MITHNVSSKWSVGILEEGDKLMTPEGLIGAVTGVGKAVDLERDNLVRLDVHGSTHIVGWEESQFVMDVSLRETHSFMMNCKDKKTYHRFFEKPVESYIVEGAGVPAWFKLVLHRMPREEDGTINNFWSTSCFYSGLYVRAWIEERNQAIFDALMVFRRYNVSYDIYCEQLTTMLHG